MNIIDKLNDEVEEFDGNPTTVILNPVDGWELTFTMEHDPQVPIHPKLMSINLVISKKLKRGEIVFE